MSFIQELEPLMCFKHLRLKTQLISDTLLQVVSDSMATKSCNRADVDECRDDFAAWNLKMIALAAILVFGVAGVAIPLVGKKRNFLHTDGNTFVAAKAFAAGVILATGFVHMLPNGTSALTDPCLPRSPWSKFPFSGFVAMMAALGTLVVDFVATQFYERKQVQKTQVSGELGLEEGLTDSVSDAGIVRDGKEEVFGEEEGGGMHIVGMHAHAAHHGHSHAEEHGACEAHVSGHSHGFGDHSDEEGSVRHVVVSQILELGIVSHSVIIGLSLGVSQSPCTIRPLIAALSFHQFFEGFALGGCISQAQFKMLATTVMACFFAITTPLGIAVGTGLSSLYNPDSPRALIIEGILDSISAGILVYMALVDLIAADFLSKRMICNFRLQVVSYFALFLGASLMSMLAIWA
ncbi:hypothetical protein GIB67_038134 [Kingdonia uniflora]|uniref:Uncharacterized protein n=1 Tax=Kingdonia uniflora TaxID=39325 RepID=A0A7J7M1Q4_9MAGN|nr:hypothetical protein GIB67_038134 [Kingdonia uniflora]